MKKFLIILAICIVIAIIVFAIINTSKDKQNEIIMVTEAGFAPYEFYEGQDIVGVDVKIAQAIADELGKKLVIKDMDFDSLINEVKSGKADFAAARTIHN